MASCGAGGYSAVVFQVSVFFPPCFKLMLRPFWIQMYSLRFVVACVYLKIPFQWCSRSATCRGSIQTVAQGAILLFSGLPFPHLPSICFVVGRGTVLCFLTQGMEREERASEASQIFLMACFSDKLQAGRRELVLPSLWGGQAAARLWNCSGRFLKEALWLLRDKVKILVSILLKKKRTHIQKKKRKPSN